MKQKPVFTPEQIETLYRFCKKHYVHHYDLQTELVDHLASAIEDKLAEDPQATFDSALDEVYKGFGFGGFARVVAQRTKEMQRRNQKIRRRIFGSYFRWPRLAFTLLLTLFIYTLAKVLPADWMNWASLLIFATVIGLETYTVAQINRLHKQLHASLLLTADVNGSFIFGYLFMQIWFSKYLWGENTFETISDVRLWLLIGIITFSVVYIRTNYAYARALFAEARQLYPQAFKTA